MCTTLGYPLDSFLCCFCLETPRNDTQTMITHTYMYMYTLSNSKTVCEVCIASCNVYGLCLSYIVHNMYMYIFHTPYPSLSIRSTSSVADTRKKFIKVTGVSPDVKRKPRPSRYTLSLTSLPVMRGSTMYDSIIAIFADTATISR